MAGGVCREIYRGAALSLQVLDRDMVRLVGHQEPYAVISITDPQHVSPNLAHSSFCRAVLRLRFSDVDERFARMQVHTPYVIAFTSDMAQQVVRFVREQLDEGTRLFVIHCEAGMSRSAGVATALSQHYNREEAFFLTHYRPNTWVRGLLLEALATGDEAEE
jgi:predicted protein tyrosine phosphatase